MTSDFFRLEDGRVETVPWKNDLERAVPLRVDSGRVVRVSDGAAYVGTVHTSDLMPLVPPQLFIWNPKEDNHG